MIAPWMFEPLRSSSRIARSSHVGCVEAAGLPEEEGGPVFGVVVGVISSQAAIVTTARAAAMAAIRTRQGIVVFVVLMWADLFIFGFPLSAWRHARKHRSACWRTAPRYSSTI